MRIATVIIMMLAAAALYAQDQLVSVLPQQVKVVTGGSFGFVSDMLIGGNPVKGAPYSAQAVTETTQTLADGTRIVQKSVAMIYRDSQGRERREQTLPAIGPFTPQGDQPEIISIFDPVAGVNYSLNPREHVAVKLPNLPISKAKVNVMFNGAGVGVGVAGPASLPVTVYGKSGYTTNTPPKVEQLGWKLIEGLQAEGTRTTITIPAGQIGNDRPIEIVDEQWRSPDLQVIVLSRHSDPRMGETVYSLTGISRADPSPTLFQVPPDYAVKDKFQIDSQSIERKLQRLEGK